MLIAKRIENNILLILNYNIMKIKSLLFAFSMLFVFVMSANGQTLKKMNYTQYGLQFSVPTTMNNTANTATQFVVSGNSLTMTLQPYKDASVETGLEIAQGMYKTMNIQDKEVLTEGEEDAGPFKGYRFFGSGTQGGKDIYFYCGGFLNPNTDTNFKVYFYFWADDKWETNLALCDKIIASFTTIK